jgi:uncharacterized protein (TIGR02147 family)
MELFEYNDYRKAIKSRFKEVQKRRAGLTWRRIASEIHVQYTYLSKVLNSDTVHLNEDHLFLICRTLEFFPNEIEFIMLLRQYVNSKDSEHQNYLLGRINELRRIKKLAVSPETLSSDNLDSQIKYLFEPLCQVVHMALDLKEYRQDPRRLCSQLSIHIHQLREILRILSQNNFIELEEDGLNLRKVHPTKIHFGPDHPLMQYHLNALKGQLLAKLVNTPQKDKYSFIATFGSDDAAFQKIRAEFQEFLNKVEKTSSRSRCDHVYQLNFDFLKWL